MNKVILCHIDGGGTLVIPVRIVVIIIKRSVWYIIMEMFKIQSSVHIIFKELLWLKIVCYGQEQVNIL
jgi:hypothetical protein